MLDRGLERMGSRREDGDIGLGHAEMRGKTSKWKWELQLRAQGPFPVG